MKNKFVRVAFLALTAITLNSCDNSENLENPDQISNTEQQVKSIKGDYIISLRDGVLKARESMRDAASENRRGAYRNTTKSLTSEILTTFSNLNLSEDAILATYSSVFKGFAAKLTQEQITFLKEDPRVENISEDHQFSLEKPVVTNSTEQKRAHHRQITP